MSQASAGLTSSPSPSPDPLMTVTPFTTFTTRRHETRPHPEITAFSSAQLVQSAQRQIDQEIRKYQDSVRALQSRRNALSPIGRLPPEILSRIFMFCSDPDSVSWIKEVSHISRHWRAVALACPNLWSFPVFSQPKWADEFLRRSKSAPLTIKADLTYMTPRMVNTVHSSLNQISRIGELDIKNGSRSVPEILNLSDAAPYLHSLCLASPGFSQEEHFQLPDTFLNGGEAPRLRRLELTRFSLPWESPLMTNLTHLKIHHPGPTARASMSELVEALKRMPLLETLELDSALPKIADGVSAISSPPNRTALPYLKRISIANVSALECADALNHLSYPPSTNAKISCVGETSTVSAFSALMSALSNAPSAGSTKDLRSLFVNIGYSAMSLQGWTYFVQAGDPPGSRAFLELDFRWLQSSRNESQELVAFTCRSLPLRGLRCLNLSTETYDLETSIWLSTFANLPTLLTVRLQAQANHFIDALREDVFVNGVKQIPPAPPVKPANRRASLRKTKARARTESVSGGLFFPALRNVTFDGTTFGDDVVDALQSALMERCERKQELWTLSLYDCTLLSYDDVQRLMEIVPEVTWDGRENGFTEEESDYDNNSDDPYGYRTFGYSDPDYDSDFDYPMF